MAIKPDFIPPSSGDGGVTDHGALTGLSDDDHSQYHDDTRGDARYTRKSNNLSDVANAGTSRTNLGLGNVDNTSDANKPVSTATQTALDLKANLASPTFTGTVGGITKSMVGLGNVDNTSDAAKPVSTATQTALDLKADLASPTFTGTVSGITKSMVGLANVDNTSDANKPISTATQTALDLKANLSAIPINHISANSDAETDTTGWSTYADAAGTSPVDGTGGSPTVTWTRSTSTPLRSTANFLLTKDAANRQGEGVSYAFTTARSDRYTVHRIKFNYEVGSGTYADNDVTVWIYDVTNSALIQPVGYQLKNVGINAIHQATFQATDSTSYRLIFHCSSTSASAYTLKIDDVEVAPQSVARGPMIGEEVSFTPTGSWVTNTTYTGKYTRNGGWANVQISLALTGAPTSTTLTVNLPFTIDTSKLNHTTSSPPFMASGGRILDSGVGYFHAEAFYSSTTVIAIRYSLASGTNTTWTDINATAPITWANNDRIDVAFSVPVLGWSSNQVLSSEEDGRVCSVEYTGNGGQALTANTTDITFSTKIRDTHGAWNGTTFTAPLPGDYLFTGSINTTASINQIIDLYVGGVQKYRIGISDAGNAIGHFNGQIYLTAGQTVTLRSGTAGTLLNGAVNHALKIHRISGPAQIAANESVSASYHVSAAFAASTTTPINYDTKEHDTHGAVTPSATAWKFTAPISGVYSVSGPVLTSTNINLTVYKNGSAFKNAGHADGVGGIRGYLNTTIPLLAGEYMDIRPGGASTITGGTKQTTGVANISIVRIGNYAV